MILINISYLNKIDLKCGLKNLLFIIQMKSNDKPRNYIPFNIFINKSKNS